MKPLWFNVTCLNLAVLFVVQCKALHCCEMHCIVVKCIVVL